MSFSPTFEKLVESLCCLSGVGVKTARRMALELLLKKQDKAKQLVNALDNALNKVQKCQKCRNLSDQELCLICTNPLRDHQVLCVVETPADVIALEQSTDFQGVYFVLLGHIAPLDGIGPEDIGLDQLDLRLKTEKIKEIILATNSTLEGNTTAYFIASIAEKHQIPTTRLASGVPIGGELAVIDQNTLSLAFKSRNKYKADD